MPNSQTSPNTITWLEFGSCVQQFLERCDPTELTVKTTGAVWADVQYTSANRNTDAPCLKIEKLIIDHSDQYLLITQVRTMTSCPFSQPKCGEILLNGTANEILTFQTPSCSKWPGVWNDGVCRISSSLFSHSLIHMTSVTFWFAALIMSPSTMTGFLPHFQSVAVQNTWDDVGRHFIQTSSFQAFPSLYWRAVVLDCMRFSSMSLINWQLSCTHTCTEYTLPCAKASIQFQW